MTIWNHHSESQFGITIWNIPRLCGKNAFLRGWRTLLIKKKHVLPKRLKQKSRTFETYFGFWWNSEYLQNRDCLLDLGERLQVSLQFKEIGVDLADDALSEGGPLNSRFRFPSDFLDSDRARSIAHTPQRHAPQRRAAQPAAELVRRQWYLRLHPVTFVTKIGCQLTEQEQLLIVSLTTVGYRA